MEQSRWRYASMVAYYDRQLLMRLMQAPRAGIVEFFLSLGCMLKLSWNVPE
jgi:hypothetical protein